ncbi:nucleotide exchange factor GrpE [Corynebacterium sp. zg-331]|uniref:nucleotide exchange factor GrpE n=1 Tax=unclassified Corynebacterium TaxID=2624378 RepID=UPI0013FFB326|nr:nucleotide exchange factor GrpE [Corynebacterium sp. zg-331]MPV52282.1 nucleotide exchange factor GrpE [Corynebacterium sp. zg331]
MTQPEEQEEKVEAASVDAEATEDTEPVEAAEAVEESTGEDQVAELTDDLKRVTAEYANYRRRSTRERQAAVDAARVSVVASLLPIVDDLVLAKQHGDLEEGPLKAFAEKLHSTLDSLGVTAFGEAGEAFDPEVHEAVQDGSSGDEKVLGTVLRQGYRLGEKTIRNAMVMVADPESAEE